jgi:hypothetical protein
VPYYIADNISCFARDHSLSLTYGHFNLAIDFFNAIAAAPSEERNSSGSEIGMEIPSKE